MCINHNYNDSVNISAFKENKKQFVKWVIHNLHFEIHSFRFTGAGPCAHKSRHNSGGPSAPSQHTVGIFTSALVCLLLSTSEHRC